MAAAAAPDGGAPQVNDFMAAAALDLAKAYAVQGLWAPYPSDDATDPAADPAHVGPDSAEAYYAEDSIKKGTRCLVLASGAIFASAAAWEHIGEISRLQEVVAAGPTQTVGFYRMVPIRPEGAVDRALLEPQVPRVENPRLVGSWNGWESVEMVWDAADQCYGSSVHLGSSGSGTFQIWCDGDWQRVLYPDAVGSSPHEPHKLCGPDDEGDGKYWTIGKHPNDKAALCTLFNVRLFVRGDGSADRVDWVKDVGLRPDAAAGEPHRVVADAELRPGAPVRVAGRRSAPSLNGVDGTCEEWDAGARRWRVRLRGGEVHALRRKHLRETCADFSGLWRNAEGRDISTVVQEGRAVTMAGPGQPWDPAAGTVTGDVLTLASPPMVRGLEGTLLPDGQLQWSNDTLWQPLDFGHGRRVVCGAAAAAGPGDSSSEDPLPPSLRRRPQPPAMIRLPSALGLLTLAVAPQLGAASAAAGAEGGAAAAPGSVGADLRGLSVPVVVMPLATPPPAALEAMEETSLAPLGGAAVPPGWEYHPGFNCVNGQGADIVPGKDMIGENMSLAQCRRACVGEPQCEAVLVLYAEDPGKCWMRMHVNPSGCYQNTPWGLWHYVRRSTTTTTTSTMTVFPPPATTASTVAVPSTAATTAAAATTKATTTAATSAAAAASTSTTAKATKAPFSVECSGSNENCVYSKCCADSTTRCYEKHERFAKCKKSCTPGVDGTEEKVLQTPWTCRVLQPAREALLPENKQSTDSMDAAAMILRKNGRYSHFHLDVSRPLSQNPALLIASSAVLLMCSALVATLARRWGSINRSGETELFNRQYVQLPLQPHRNLLT